MADILKKRTLFLFPDSDKKASCFIAKKGQYTQLRYTGAGNGNHFVDI